MTLDVIVCTRRQVLGRDCKGQYSKKVPALIRKLYAFLLQPVCVVTRTFSSQSDAVTGTLMIRFKIKLQSFLCHEHVWDIGCRAPFALQSSILYNELLVSLSSHLISSTH